MESQKSGRVCAFLSLFGAVCPTLSPLGSLPARTHSRYRFLFFLALQRLVFIGCRLWAVAIHLTIKPEACWWPSCPKTGIVIMTLDVLDETTALLKLVLCSKPCTCSYWLTQEYTWFSDGTLVCLFLDDTVVYFWRLAAEHVGCAMSQNAW